MRELGVRASFNSTLDASTAAEVERALIEGELDSLYVAPERLQSRTLALPNAVRSRSLPLMRRTSRSGAMTGSTTSSACFMSSSPPYRARSHRHRR